MNFLHIYTFAFGGGGAYIVTSEIIPTHRGCLVIVCVKSLNAFSTCCSDKLQHFFPSNLCVWYVPHCKCSKVLQTRILVHLKIRLSCIQTGVTIVDVYPIVPETYDRTLFFSNHHHPFLQLLNECVHSFMRWHHLRCCPWFSEWCEGHSTVPPLLIKPVFRLHSQLFL